MSDRFVSGNPGRDVQRVGTACFLGQDPQKIHEPVWAVTGNLGDSQCYLGVMAKVDAILFVVDTVNTVPGSAGEVWVSEVRAEGAEN